MDTAMLQYWDGHSLGIKALVAFHFFKSSWATSMDSGCSKSPVCSKVACWSPMLLSW